MIHLSSTLRNSIRLCGVSFRFLVHPSSTCLFTVGVEGFDLDLMTLGHTPQSGGLLWTRDRPVAETSTWQHKLYKRQTSMLQVGFEPTIPASARPQTYALARHLLCLRTKFHTAAPIVEQPFQPNRNLKKSQATIKFFTSWKNTIFKKSHTPKICYHASLQDPNVQVVYASQVRESAMLLLLTVGN
jgi:hypothetical protein